MGFKENLRFLMDSKDIQIKELSQKSGISENTIKSYLKTASAEPTISKAAKIAQVLDTSLEALLGVQQEESQKSLLQNDLLRESEKLSVKNLKILIKIARDLQGE